MARSRALGELRLEHMEPLLAGLLDLHLELSLFEPMPWMAWMSISALSRHFSASVSFGSADWGPWPELAPAGPAPPGPPL
eukprot:6520503-Pyramimonas_sp.AAC.1